MARLIDAFEQFFDSAGDPLVSGLLYFYESGSSTVLKTTYADAALTTPNTNPVEIKGDGRCPPVFGEGSYRAVLTDMSGGQIGDPKDPLGGETGVTFGSDWNSSQIYSQNAVVLYDGRYYYSNVNNNQNMQPDLNPDEWSVLFWIRAWSTDGTYQTGDLVYGSDGVRYRSTIDDNTGTDPVGDTSGDWVVDSVSRIKLSEITSSSTFNPDPGTVSLKMTIVGAGGGGAGADGQGAGTAAAAGGGGGGATVILNVGPAGTIDPSYTITIGAGGANGAGSGGGAGTAGGNTTVVSANANCTAGGGGGGTGMIGNGAQTGAAGGAGGSASSSDGNTVLIDGDAGDTGIVSVGSINAIGYGGASSLGGRHAPTYNGVGGSASVYGVGGGGGSSQSITGNSAGGSGEDGVVIIEEVVYG